MVTTALLIIQILHLMDIVAPQKTGLVILLIVQVTVMMVSAILQPERILKIVPVIVVLMVAEMVFVHT